MGLYSDGNALTEGERKYFMEGMKAGFAFGCGAGLLMGSLWSLL